MIYTIIGAIICIIGLAILNTKEKWDKNTKPPKGWMKHKGNFTKMP